MRCFALIIAFLLLMPPPPAKAAEDDGRADGQAVHIAPFPKPEDCETVRCRAYWAAIDASQCKEAEKIVLADTPYAHRPEELERGQELLSAEYEAFHLRRTRYVRKEIYPKFPELSLCHHLQVYQDGQAMLDRDGLVVSYADDDEDMFEHPTLRRPADKEGSRSTGLVIRDFAIDMITLQARCLDYGPAYRVLADLVREGRAFPRSQQRGYFLLSLAVHFGDEVEGQLRALEAELGPKASARITQQAKVWRLRNRQKKYCPIYQ